MTDRSTYLCDDILLHILDFARQGTIIGALMQTCHMLHEHGMKYLLQNGVHLMTNEQILSFMFFIVGNSGSEEPPRLLRLRELTLSRRPVGEAPRSGLIPSPKVVGIVLHWFFTAIASFCCLVGLTINDSEEVLGLHPALLEAIAGLRTLTHLTVSFVGVLTVRILKALRSALSYAHMSIDNESELSLEDQNPMWLLHGSQDTLRQLSTAFSVSTPGSPIYPLVTVLNLSYADILRTQHYVRAFLALRILAIDNCYGWGNYEDFSARRARNQDEQDHLGAWPSLESYSGSVRIPNMLGLRCPIGTMKLSNDVEAPHPTVLCAVLGDTRPRRLQLRVYGGHCLVDPDFLNTFAHPGVDALKRFELFVNMQPGNRDMDIFAALVSPHRSGSAICRAVLKQHLRTRSCWRRASSRR